MQQFLKQPKLIKKPMSKSLLVDNSNQQKNPMQKNQMRKSCFIQRITNLAIDHQNRQQFSFQSQKRPRNMTCVTSTIKDLSKQGSQDTRHSFDQQQFVHNYKTDPLFRHSIDRVIKKYKNKKIRQEILVSQNNSGYTLRIKKINEDLELIRLYEKYEQILQKRS